MGRSRKCHKSTRSTSSSISIPARNQEPSEPSGKKQSRTIVDVPDNSDGNEHVNDSKNPASTQNGKVRGLSDEQELIETSPIQMNPTLQTLLDFQRGISGSSHVISGKYPEYLVGFSNWAPHSHAHRALSHTHLRSWMQSCKLSCIHRALSRPHLGL
ncbi:hypothetical protein PTTG_01137 [Puccinia triticina 1-1 BBBD Race 1]|uniref:Uncharacterized protein n=1 Tax=Puccinia triticina (isolate 1-1 / race 1 (BBBD)) TaxID=630390 RepID=A0A0C4EK64_PUCT1|nr:hypothetical protein PTTG_01137 [Puccinia triticina 1-1 BBBD Race 1]